MIFNWVTKETKSFYIARPPEADAQLIYLHPDKSVPRGSKITVRSDECALFFREGRFVGRINAGTVQLDTANIPFLGHLLIDKFTDANHFICEIFFVALNESIFEINSSPIGQFRDSNSANVVSIYGSLSYTVRVVDPVKLVVELGGQSDNSGSVTQTILNGRMLNQLRKAVGVLTQKRPVLDVVSNVEIESISEEIRKIASHEFLSTGISVERVYDLLLNLDDESYALLRAFGVQESELALQAKGMQLATGEGFAEFNIVQGQRAALEGLGKGLSTGNGPMILSGGLGANLTGGLPNGSTARRSSNGGGTSQRVAGGLIASAPPSYLVIEGTSNSGPYSARQVALLAISKGIPIGQLLIRTPEDPEDINYPADGEPQILAEFNRRGGLRSQVRSEAVIATDVSVDVSGVPGFLAAFKNLTSDGMLAKSAVDLLVALVTDAHSGLSKAAAQDLVTNFARARNVKVDSK